MTTAIWWVRRDLRLNDNDALRAALAHGGRVVPVFVLDPTLLAAPDISAKRLAFLFGGLRALDADLRARGSRLIVRRGDPAAELARLVAETGAEALYAEADPWPYGRRRDAAIAAQLPLRLLSGLTAQPFDLIRKADGTPYTVFTPFSRAWKALPLPTPAQLWAPPERLPAVPEGLQSLPIPDEPALPPTRAFSARRGRGAAAAARVRRREHDRHPRLCRRPQPDGSGRHVATFALPAFRHGVGAARGGVGAARAWRLHLMSRRAAVQKRGSTS